MLDPHAELLRINARIKEILLRHMPRTGTYDSPVPGLVMRRLETCHTTTTCLGKPSASIIVQGEKIAMLGDREIHYGEGQCLVTGIDMPNAFRVLQACHDHPFLAMSLELDRSLTGQMVKELADAVPPAARPDSGVSLGTTSPELLDAFLRLARLLDTPERIPILAPLVIREIHYLLLIGPQGAGLRQLNTHGTQANSIALATDWLRKNYRKPLLVSQLARQVNMGTSTFHRHFKEVTGMSPLQYHKRLRLYEAQRLMLAGEMDAGSAGLAVGYESTAQFNREYKRLSDGQKHEVADVAYGDDLGQLGGTQLEVGREDRGKNAPHGIVRAQTHHQDQERGKRDDVLFLVHWFIPQKKPPPGPTRQKGPAPMRRLVQYFQMAQPSSMLWYSGAAASAVRPMVCTLVQF